MEELNNVIEETNEAEVYDLYPEDEEETFESGGGFGKVLIGICGVAAVGLGALAVKNRNKIKEMKLANAKKKLEKAGYLVEEPIVEEVLEDDDFEEEVVTEEKKEEKKK